MYKKIIGLRKLKIQIMKQTKKKKRRRLKRKGKLHRTAKAQRRYKDL